MAFRYRYTTQQQDSRRLSERRNKDSSQARSSISKGAEDVARGAENGYEESEEEAHSEHAWTKWREGVEWIGDESALRREDRDFTGRSLHA